MTRLFRALIAAGLALAASPVLAQQAIPNPVLHLTGTEEYSIDRDGAHSEWTRYRYGVANKAEFPVALFAKAPTLPPCGTNTNSARSWVDFFSAEGKRIYGFCALGSPNDLDSIWFALPRGEVPPSYVYIVITDRQTNTQYKSNFAETTQ
jgi:hypothetical protein